MISHQVTRKVERQTAFKLKINPRDFRDQFEAKHQQNLLDGKGYSKYTQGEELASYLKEMSKQVMEFVTRCDTQFIPTAYTWMRSVENLCEHAIHCKWVHDRETVRTEVHFINCITVMDFIACMAQTRQSHRAPACVKFVNDDLERLERKLDIIAGAIAVTPELQELFFGGKEAQNEI